MQVEQASPERASRGVHAPYGHLRMKEQSKASSKHEQIQDDGPLNVYFEDCVGRHTCTARELASLQLVNSS